MNPHSPPGPLGVQHADERDRGDEVAAGGQPDGERAGLKRVQRVGGRGQRRRGRQRDAGREDDPLATDPREHPADRDPRRGGAEPHERRDRADRRRREAQILLELRDQRGERDPPEVDEEDQPAEGGEEALRHVNGCWFSPWGSSVAELGRHNGIVPPARVVNE